MEQIYCRSAMKLFMFMQFLFIACSTIIGRGFALEYWTTVTMQKLHWNARIAVCHGVLHWNAGQLGSCIGMQDNCWHEVLH